jgi:hypothetical protein
LASALEAPARLPKLASLSLRGAIDKARATALARALSRGGLTSLTFLDLSECQNIGDPRLTALMEALRPPSVCPALVRVDLRTIGATTYAPLMSLLPPPDAKALKERALDAEAREGRAFLWRAREVRVRSTLTLVVGDELEE